MNQYNKIHTVERVEPRSANGNPIGGLDQS